jgi:hypothetical protein
MAKLGWWFIVGWRGAKERPPPSGHVVGRRGDGACRHLRVLCQRRALSQSAEQTMVARFAPTRSQRGQRADPCAAQPFGIAHVHAPTASHERSAVNRRGVCRCRLPINKPWISSNARASVRPRRWARSAQISGSRLAKRRLKYEQGSGICAITRAPRTSADLCFLLPLPPSQPSQQDQPTNQRKPPCRSLSRP